MSDAIRICWTDGYGNEVTRDIKQTIDVRDHIGAPGYSLLIVAANTHLSVSEIERFLSVMDRECEGVERSRSWIQRRRWLFQRPGTDNTKVPMPNRDGKQDRATALMAEHSRLSVRDLTLLLAKYGIRRSREWVRRHRCDALS